MDTAAPAAPAADAPSTAPADASPGVVDVTGASGAEPKAPAAAPEPKAAPETPKRYRVKVDGEELEVEEAELLRGYQRASAARKRFDEAQAARAEIEELKKLGDPWKIAEKLLGTKPEDLDQAAEQRLLERLRRESMTPEQRRIAELEAERERFLAEQQTRQRQEEEQRFESQAKAHREHLNRELPKAMDAASLPRTAEAAKLVIHHLETQVRLGLEWDIKAAAEMAAADLMERNVSVLRAMDPEALARALGEETVAKILRRSLDKPAPTPQPKAPAPAPAPERSWLSRQEWERQFGG